MIQVIVTGHGSFPSGMLSALSLIAGEQAHIHSVDFLESYSTEDLKEIIERKLQAIGNQVIILTDLAGGSPYNVSVMLKAEQVNKEIAVIAGVNFPMLLSCAFSADTTDFEGLVDCLIEEGKNAIAKFELAITNQNNEDEDGI